MINTLSGPNQQDALDVCPPQRTALCPVLSMNRHRAPVVLRQPRRSQFIVSIPARGAEAEAEEQGEAGVSWRTAVGFQPILPAHPRLDSFGEANHRAPGGIWNTNTLKNGQVRY